MQRLRWIEAKLYWTGEMSRPDLMRRFSISASQASLDLAAYRDLAPGNVALDHADKRIKACEPFDPVFVHEARVWLEDERQAGTDSVPECVRADDPWTSAPVDVLRTVVRAATNRTCLRVTYGSLSSGTREARVLSPHAVVDVGDRLHTRAFDHGKSRFADFVLNRMSDPAVAPEEQWVDGAADADWNETVGIELAPDPDLPAMQAETAMAELGLPPGGGKVAVRRAMAFYLLERIGFLEPSRGRYVCANFAELSAALRLPTAGHVANF